jgi:hypothetical protein
MYWPMSLLLEASLRRIPATRSAPAHARADGARRDLARPAALGRPRCSSSSWPPLGFTVPALFVSRRSMTVYEQMGAFRTASARPRAPADRAGGRAGLGDAAVESSRPPARPVRSWPTPLTAVRAVAAVVWLATAVAPRDLRGRAGSFFRPCR